MIEQNLDDKIISDVTRKRNHDDVFHESEYGMKISDQQFQCSVGIIDIINSTKITSICDPSKLNKYYGVFLNTMIPIVTKFGGGIAKITGDGFFSYDSYSAESKV